MPFTLTMPKMSPTMTEGTIAKWHVKVGDHVEVGDLLFEVATDKATVEYNALDEGYLREIIVAEDGEAVVNQAVAVFTEEKKESIKGYKPEGVTTDEEKPAGEVKADDKSDTAKKAPVKQVTTGTPALALPSFTPEPPLLEYRFNTDAGAAKERLRASPLARKLAKERGLDITTVQGTGPRGRIMERDLARAQGGGPVAFGRKEWPKHSPGTYEEQAMTPMRKAIGQRLQEAKTFIPHFYTEQDVDASAMVALREQLKRQGVKVTFNDFVVRASALALRQHPVINSGYNTETQSTVEYKTIDISIAVSVDGGLITPIVRHADYKNLGSLSTEVRDLAGKARDGKLEPHEYRGGSFTISNLGMYGITRFTAIINPPQGAILAVGGVRDVPVVKDGSVVPGKRMCCTLSADHRVIDGAAAAEFLRTLRGFLEDPAVLLV